MKKIFYLLLFFVTGIIIINSCKHQPVVAVITVPPPVTGPCNCVCFETDILPLFQATCAMSGCHDAASHQKDYVLDTYANIITSNHGEGIRAGDPLNSKIYKVLFETGSKQMPPLPASPLTMTQINLIGKWITEGAKNTVGCNTYTCDSNSFKYSTNVSVIISTYCTFNQLCHAGPAPISTINLTTWINVKPYTVNGLSSRLVGAVTHSNGYSPMPKDLPKLNDCQLTQIKKWVLAGALNN